ncbi:NUDIX hydrolase [uncultured Rhodoblastus sp.]|uniref:NUDIX hydrolase n=1 Tax=uncultured Rhodoblastus sp. TaxID=543037 RepID=UPI0025D490AE|nr:NUDIX hydrolase [uncultured Rhodoblastus sp.]
MRNGIFSVARIETALKPGPWDFARDEAARIDAHWRERLAEKPKLFDGRVLLLREAEILATPDGGLLRGGFFETDFRNFLAWRDFGFPDRAVYNCFSMAALRSRDGAWLLGESGAHTMNAGKIYFAAGTPDPNDIRGETVDLAASVAREMLEETGFSPEEAPPAPGWRIVVAGQKIACMQLRFLGLPAAQACARAQEFIADDPQAELARLHAVRGAADIDAGRMPDFIQIFLRDAFAAGAAGAKPLMLRRP